MDYYLIYVSKADHTMSNSELQLILDQSIRWNKDHDITGMLIYVEGLYANVDKRKITMDVSGRFMQVLEGPENEVIRVFNIICADLRHKDIFLLHEGYQTARNFKDWQMGFESFTLDQYADIPGHFNLNRSFTEISVKDHGNVPLKFLKYFYQRGLCASPLFSNSTD